VPAEYLFSEATMPLAPDAEAALREKLKAVFDTFDADKSGEVSTAEIDAMMQSLGMLVQPDTLKAMMEEADTDKSGEIDFEEFFTVMKKQAEGAGGGPFAALVNRQKNAGPAMKWRTDKMGKGCKVDDTDVRKVIKEGEGWGAVMLDGLLRDGKSDGSYDAADYLLELKNVSGPMYVGVASNNFDPCEAVEPNASGGSAGNTIVTSSVNGKVFSKKMDLAPVRASPVPALCTRFADAMSRPDYTPVTDADMAFVVTAGHGHGRVYLGRHVPDRAPHAELDGQFQRAQPQERDQVERRSGCEAGRGLAHGWLRAGGGGQAALRGHPQGPIVREVGGQRDGLQRDRLQREESGGRRAERGGDVARIVARGAHFRCGFCALEGTPPLVFIIEDLQECRRRRLSRWPRTTL
jgi:hypothetical protein